MSGQGTEVLNLRGHGLFSRGRGDRESPVIPGDPLNLGVGGSGAAEPEDGVGFPMPELVTVLNLGWAVVDAGPPLEPITMGTPPAFAAATFPSAGQVLPQLPVPLRRGVDEGVDRLRAHPHFWVVGEVDGQSPGDLFRAPALLQVGDHPVQEPVVEHPVRAVAALLTPISPRLRLRGPVLPSGGLPDAQADRFVLGVGRRRVRRPTRIPGHLTADR